MAAEDRPFDRSTGDRSELARKSKSGQLLAPNILKYKSRRQDLPDTATAVLFTRLPELRARKVDASQARHQKRHPRRQPSRGLRFAR